MVGENEISPYEKIISAEMNDRMDRLEAALLAQPQVKCPTNHFFTPGIYMRQIVMYSQTVVMSMIHKFEHPFVVTQGKAKVKVNDEPWETIEAPFYGVTKPGSRRVLKIEELCIWTTIHPLDFIQGTENNLSKEEKLELVNRIVEIIFEKHDNPYLGNLSIEHSIKEGIKCQEQ